MLNKRGMSAILVTLIIVLVSIIAVGVVWTIVSNFVDSGKEDIEYAQLCLNMEVKPVSVDCSVPTACDVVLERTGTNQEEIVGVKLVFRDSSAGTSSAVIEDVGNIESLVGKIITGVDSEVVAPDSVEVTAYFEDEAGEDRLCSTSKLEFS